MQMYCDSPIDVTFAIRIRGGRGFQAGERNIN